MLALIVVAAAFDWSGAFIDRPIEKETLVPSDAEQAVLRTCEDGSTSYTGPLVPRQVTPTVESSLQEIPSGEPVPTQARSSRVGFSISSPTDPEYWARLLGSGWYIDWTLQSGTHSTNLDHWQMVRVHEDCISPSQAEIRSAAASLPSQVWIIGNEPDVIWQDNVTPARYAVVYHDLYLLIRASDPSAKIAVGGISQATPLRLQYLDQVLQTYQDFFQEAMPADWWTVHGYVLREEQGSWGVDIPPGLDATRGEIREVSDHGRLDLFEGQLRSFRQWMGYNGYQNTPLAVTEFGILMPVAYGFPKEFIADYLEQTFTWLSEEKDPSIGNAQDGYHLVQKWAWFSLSDPTYPSSNLGDLSTGQLTQIGERFRDIVPLMVP